MYNYRETDTFNIAKKISVMLQRVEHANLQVQHQVQASRMLQLSHNDASVS